MDEVKFVREGPLIFGIIDFESAVRGDAGDVSNDIP
jgi:hypothetical protein